MNLRKISAVGSQLLPNIRNCINTKYFHSHISQIQDISYHFIKYFRIVIIQIPLIRIKCCEHMSVHLFTPCKVARRSFREHLWHRLLKLIRNLACLITLIAIHIFLFASLGSHRPLMRICCMIHNNIQTQTDSAFSQLFCQLFQLFVCSNFRIYLFKILYRIATVIIWMRHFQKRHQMKIGDLLLRQIIQMLYHTV